MKQRRTCAVHRARRRLATQPRQDVLATVKATCTTSADIVAVLQCNNYEVVNWRHGRGNRSRSRRTEKADIIACRTDTRRWRNGTQRARCSASRPFRCWSRRRFARAHCGQIAPHYAGRWCGTGCLALRGVCSMLSDDQARATSATSRDYERIREQHAARRAELIPLAAAAPTACHDWRRTPAEAEWPLKY